MEKWIWPACLAFAAFTLLGSCRLMPAMSLPPPDTTPPALITKRLAEDSTLELTFDETVTEAVLSSPELGDRPEVYFLDRLVRVVWENPPQPGREHSFHLEAADAQGNHRSLDSTIMGLNPSPARARIQELGAAGNPRKPDFLELVVTKSGSLAGLTVFGGTPEDHDFRFVFPDEKVEKGSVLLLRCPGNVSPAVLGEREWLLPAGSGFSAGTGVVSILESPDGPVQDVLVYSVRTSASDKRYGGWGNLKMRARAHWAQERGGWIFGGVPAPEKAASSFGMTLTKTLGRRSETDTDTQKDWIVCPRGEASPGRL